MNISADATTEPLTKRPKLATEDGNVEATEPEHDTGDVVDSSVDQENESTTAVDGDELESECAKPATERDVGITEYLSSNEGFTAIIKQRYSDFLVNEVDIRGNKAVLTDIEEPKCDEGIEPEKELDLTDIFTPEQLENLKTTNSERKGEVLIPADEDKAKRTAVHQAIRKHFTSLESAFTEKDGSKYIRAAPSKSNKQKKQRGWPKGRPECCKFVLYKENVDTIEAVNILAKYMRINAGAFTYAGTKDKRAKTSQYLTANKMEATRLHKLNRVLRGMTLGNFSYVPAPLKLGDLQGNHFTIILRNVTGSDTQINDNMAVLSRIGFINYFGMQRFGTSSVPTHHIGRAILHSKWEEVVDLILRPRDKDNEDIAAARRTWAETKDATAALSALGRRAGIERHLLVGLSKTPANLVTAINHIPKNTRLMYVHSYQAYIWNRMVSTRLSQGGTTLAPGDLVISQAERDSNKRPEPVKITEENIGDYTIHDLVMPTPGYDVIYPEGEIMDKYEQLLKEDGFDFKSFRHKVKDYSLSGMYRVVLHKPRDLQYEILAYTDYTRPLILSDLERLKGQTISAAEEAGENCGSEKTQMKALKLEFTLPPSTYATMLFREVLKTDTSAAFQTTLNVT